MPKSEIELAKFIPGEKLLKRPLVDKIVKFLGAVKFTYWGNHLATQFKFIVDDRTFVELNQENRPTDQPGILIPSIHLWPLRSSGPGWAISMEGISTIEAITESDKERRIRVIQEGSTHIQTISLSNDGFYGSTTELRVPSK